MLGSRNMLAIFGLYRKEPAGISAGFDEGSATSPAEKCGRMTNRFLFSLF